jgi:hypothetical protein
MEKRLLIIPLFLIVPIYLQDALAMKGEGVSSESFQQNQRIRELSEKYGNKYANLVRLQEKIIKNDELKQHLIKLGEYTVDVPPFTGLSDAQAQDFLKKQKFDVEQSWREHGVKESKAVSDTISALMKDEPRLTGAISKPVPMLKLMALKKLAEIQRQKLMMRSTGKEDTEAVTNPGGNVSVPNVEPSWKAMGRASDEVIASYFSEKSIGQRLAEHDESIHQRPIIPVLLQIMIGEEEWGFGKIPVGCVVYTQDPCANTPGVTVIQASWGHNTGVVDNTVEIDTYFINWQNSLNALIKTKPERWIPVKEFGKDELKKVSNRASIQKEPVLDYSSALAIKAVADAIHAEYGKPMDIELVYLPYLKKIYLVQARPLKVTSEFSPSYLKELDVEPENILQGSTVLPGNCKLRYITDKNQIIVAKTLNEACNIFISPSYKKDSVQAVIVKGNAEMTSHAAAIFRGDAKPVLVVKNIEKIEQWLQAKAVPLIIDIQRGVVLNKPLENLVVLDGWFTHPMPKKISIPQFVEHEQNSYTDYFPDKSFQELIGILKEADEPSTNQALDSILNRISLKLKAVASDKRNFAKEVVDKLKRLFAYACKCGQGIRFVLSKPAFNIQRLYEIHFLECLLFQDRDDLYIDVFSFFSVVSEYDKYCNFIKEKANFLQTMSDKELIEITSKGFECALVTKTEEMWNGFIAKILQASNPSGWVGAFWATAKSYYGAQTPLTQFVQVARHMINFGALPTWINTIFATTWSSDLDVNIYVNALWKEFEKNKQFLEILSKWKQDIRIQTSNLNGWEDPNKFEEKLRALSNLSSFDIQHEFKTGSNLIKILILQVMDSFVDLFDQSIKRLKGSTRYSSVETKVKNFRQMVKAYFDIFNSWAQLLPEGKLKMHFRWNLSEYLTQMKVFLGHKRPKDLEPVFYPADRSRLWFYKKTDSKGERKTYMASELATATDAKQLEPGFQFNVAQLALDSGADFGRGTPHTLEDMFTLIHQNLLVILGVLLNDTIPQDFPKPELFNEIQKICGTFGSTVGVTLNNDRILVKYNRTLANHSLMYELSFDKGTNQTFITVRFVGPARHRWRWILDFARIQALFVLKIEDYKIGDDEVCITHEIKDQEDVNALYSSMDAMCTIAGDHHGNSCEAVIRNLIGASEERKRQFLMYLFNNEVFCLDIINLYGYYITKNLIPEDLIEPFYVRAVEWATKDIKKYKHPQDWEADNLQNRLNLADCVLKSIDKVSAHHVLKVALELMEIIKRDFCKSPELKNVLKKMFSKLLEVGKFENKTEEEIETTLESAYLR